MIKDMGFSARRDLLFPDFSPGEKIGNNELTANLQRSTANNSDFSEFRRRLRVQLPGRVFPSLIFPNSGTLAHEVKGRGWRSQPESPLSQILMHRAPERIKLAQD